MSQKIFLDDLIFYQRLLASQGYYKDTLDGIWGKNTDAADKKFEKDARALRDSFGELDSRSERNLTTLQVPAQQQVREFMAELSAAGFEFTVKILSGTRTYAQQNAIFAKGRFGNPGPRVTNARGGFSNHNFGIAWDIGIFDGGEYFNGDTQREVNAYANVAGIVDLTGLEWGGNWTSLKDRPHYEVAIGKKISEKRALFEQGKLVV